MNNILELIKDYNDAVSVMVNCYGEIFSKDNAKLFKERIIEISQLIAKIEKEPATCTETFSIPFEIVNIVKDKKDPFDGMHGIYIDWTIDGANIVAKAETVFRGETHSRFKYKIPVDNKAYNNYLSGLEDKANANAEKIAKEEYDAKKYEEEKERQLYVKLKEKYGQ